MTDWIGDDVFIEFDRETSEIRVYLMETGELLSTVKVGPEEKEPE